MVTIAARIFLESPLFFSIIHVSPFDLYLPREVHREDQMLFYSGTLLLSLTFISLEGGSCRGKIASPVETLWEHKGNMQSRPAIVFCFVLFPQGRVIRFLHSKQTCNQPFFIFLPECNYCNILQYMSSNYRG